MGDFSTRHIGPDEGESHRMLGELGFATMADFIAACVPADIATGSPQGLPQPLSEQDTLARLHKIAALNNPNLSMIGLGYYNTVTPSVIRRNVIENPAWYTAYTPYQPEIAQGRLEALLVFQTVIEELTALPVANASLLDEPTAAAEAMTLCRRVSKSESNVFLVDADTHPQTQAVLRTRAEPLDIEIKLIDLDNPGLNSTLDLTGDLGPVGHFGLLISNPTSSGHVREQDLLVKIVERSHNEGGQVVVATDLLSLMLIEGPGRWGADIAIGSAQRFGVPMGFGGPHAGFIAVRDGLERQLPGRLVGVSVDTSGRPAYRLSLQTREQHIRRDKATSNICTSQVLLAVVAALYAAYHGPEGLRAIALRVQQHAIAVAKAATSAGFKVAHTCFFDTVTISCPGLATDIVKDLASRGIDVRLVDRDHVGVSCDELTTVEDVDRISNCLTSFKLEAMGAVVANLGLGTNLVSRELLTEPMFDVHRSETSMMRWLRRMADADLALDRSMIPLGSCTMKLNSAVEMEAVTWPEFANLHPFAPADQSLGTQIIISDLCSWLAAITGYDSISLQPNAGSQGEFAGLMAIRAYHLSRSDVHRQICLIPESAHGTNAASAVMCGMTVVAIGCDEFGDVDLVELAEKIASHGPNLAAIMITYPSTHGVFESGVRQICEMVHEAGGQVYVDGANMNALVGTAAPGNFGADVSHLNLHKTFCIPHGGGGPGVGPIGVKAHLTPFLPSHPLAQPEFAALCASTGPVGPVSGAPFGSAGVLCIPWAYISLMGADDLREASITAILSANYLAKKLDKHFSVLYTNKAKLVAHECVLDLRPITAKTGVSAEDIAKRLMDYGFHAPTMSWPVAGTLMVEPTESENLAELDRFINAMAGIRGEIDQVINGVWSLEDSPLRLAPHTAQDLVGDWQRPYSRAIGVYPTGQTRAKYWPPVNRIDAAFGDRNLVCSCPPVSAFVT